MIACIFVFDVCLYNIVSLAFFFRLSLFDSFCRIADSKKQNKQTKKKRERIYSADVFLFKNSFSSCILFLWLGSKRNAEEKETTKLHDFSIPHVHIFSFDASFMCVEWGSDAGQLLVSQCVCFPLLHRQQPLAIHRPPYKSIAYKPHARIR